MKKMAALIFAGVLTAGFAGAAPHEGNAEKGKEVFEQCGACHEVSSPEKKMGPSLQGLYKKPKLKNGKPVTDASVKAIIDAGGNGMPAYEDLLTPEEKGDLLAYLKTI